MNKHISWLIAALIIAAAQACTETTDKMGVTLTPSVDLVTVFTDTFDVYTNSVSVDSVLARNNYRYIGKVIDPETESTVTASFQMQLAYQTGQLLSISGDTVYPIKKTYQGKEMYLADSCNIILLFSDVYGDTTALMRCRVYELDKPLENSEAYYTNFDIKNGGYIREDGIKKNVSFTAFNADYSGSEDSYTHSLIIPLNEEYTDKNGNVYNNYGTYLINSYEQNPNNFSTSYKFLHNVSPGFYIEYENGLGSMVRVDRAYLNMYYQYRITTPNIVDSLAVDTIATTYTLIPSSEEVLNTTFFDSDTEANTKLAESTDYTCLKTPAGIFTEAALPVLEIMENHENDTVNAAEITFQRLNEEQQYEYAFSSPTTLLLLETDSVKSFFESRKVIDNKRSFTTSLSSNQYKFSNISSLITSMYQAYKAASDKEAWVKQHPNWNKVTLVPVSTSVSSTTSAVTAVYNELGLTSTKLVGGDTPLRIKIVYSNFNEE